jgi:uncharacterized repeat protein (TIGR02543 family)
MTLYAGWEMVYVSLTLASDGAVMDSLILPQGSIVFTLEPPETPGRVFLGWFTSDNIELVLPVAMEHNLTVQARWIREVFIIGFRTNGGDALDAVQVEAGHTLANPPIPQKSGYTFKGWFTNRTLGVRFDPQKPVMAHCMLYAAWMRESFQVTYNPMGGGDVAPASVARASQAKEPAEPTRPGYVFSGWATDPACQGLWNFAWEVHSDITLYACWTPIV